MRGSTGKNGMNRKDTISEKLEELKSRISQLHEDIPFLEQCSRLSIFLQELYQIREKLNQLEQ